jgi:hypothetical protein
MIRDVHPASGIRIFLPISDPGSKGTGYGSRIRKLCVYRSVRHLSGLVLCVCVLLPEPGEDGSVRLPGQPVPANYLNQGQYVGAGTFILQHNTGTQVYTR